MTLVARPPSFMPAISHMNSAISPTNQRVLLASLLVTLLIGCTSTRPSALTLAGRKCFVPGRPGVRMIGGAFYTRPSGVELCRLVSEQTKSDKADVTWRSFSTDNGLTWSEPTRIDTFTRVAGGMQRRYLHPGFVDPTTGTLITLINQAVLPTDNPLEGMTHGTLHYALSKDGGRSAYYEGAVVQCGGEYNADHPLPSVWVGKNAVALGAITCVPIGLRSGEILVPLQISPLGPGGNYYNPGGGYTYTDAAVLVGRWNQTGTLDWELSALVRGDPACSTRGMVEPTNAEMPDGRVLMVLRGSNDKRPALPGYRWYAVSTDGGRTWSAPQPWKYTNGNRFYSPSSCSQLLRHSNGRTYWVGNISPDNPRGNRPRYPLVIGEVDPKSLFLIKETLCTLDDRREGDLDTLAFSNFYAREDRVTHEILVHCSPIGQRSVTASRSPPHPNPKGFDWTANAYIYRIDVPVLPKNSAETTWRIEP